MKEIPLSQGKVALVDDEDFDRLNQFKWYAIKPHRIFYAVRHKQREDGERRLVYMHREVLSVLPSMEVDHKDGDGLNNTRDNLRPATEHQNQCNRTATRKNASGYKGVTWHKGNRKWRAQIVVNGKAKHLANCVTAEDAARAYDAAARELHGEFAKVNFEP